MREKAAGSYRLLILDGHNSHCTYKFCQYAAKNKIIVLCLPSHTTHALQPCDVGAFGPLAQSWKRIVTAASQSLIAITKDNLLSYYHTARVEALKTQTIQSAFQKTGIWPLNRDAIPVSAFEPAKNTTTRAAQPLPARLPAILVRTPVPTPTPSPTTTPAPSVAPTRAASTTPDAEQGDDEEEEPMERYHIEIPPPLPGTASRQALMAENAILLDIIVQAGNALEADYAQMKLMDLENERLRKRAFEKEKHKSHTAPASGHARHMTAEENLIELAKIDWRNAMKDIWKELQPRFQVIKKAYSNQQKEIARAKKVAEREAKKVATAVMRAQRARGRSRGRAAARGTGRGGRGRGGRTGGGDDGDTDSEIPSSSEGSDSSSSSESESEDDIPVP